MEKCKAKKLCLFPVIFVGMILTILLGSCSRESLTSNRPSDYDINKAIEAQTEYDIENKRSPFSTYARVRLISFKKTDGVQGEMWGVKQYIVFFDAAFECLTDGDMPGFYTTNAPCEQGKQVTVKGQTTLFKTEKGWQRRQE